jgi:hypothetical protein
MRYSSSRCSIPASVHYSHRLTALWSSSSAPQVVTQGRPQLRVTLYRGSLHNNELHLYYRQVDTFGLFREYLYVGKLVSLILIHKYSETCIRRKFAQCGKYFRSHAVPHYTSFTVYNLYVYISVDVPITVAARTEV